MKKIALAIAVIARGMAALALSAMAWFAFLSFGGVAFIVAGVYVLAGIGWAMLICGAAFLFFAGFVMRGLANG